MLLLGRYVLGLKDPFFEPRPPPSSAVEEDDPYETISKKDQILAFLEYDFERHAAYLKEDGEARQKDFEKLRVQYYNCINGIEFQNEQIAVAVNELLECREALRKNEPVTKEARVERRELLMRVEHVKLDISDRKSKRYFKQKERREVASQIVPIISDLKMKRFLDSEAANSRVEEMEPVPATLMAGPPTVGMRQRKGKAYSDEELAFLLKQKDE
uniref:Uncharacterized protein n=1 Tax=Oxyrrhis marina TaxID=2969 RepID=A0A7S3UMK2_OXYMA|mmetsp:Transcript_3019/g.4704  ORF Transcript_3019/g.4704 Transcript_3019/m.4704 type:complete len:215 (+) Transcript_3019:67-711(+)